MPKNPSSNSLHALYSQVKEDGAPKKLHRHIPSNPDRVLDAPEMKDDYYLNLLDWGSNNILYCAYLFIITFSCALCVQQPIYDLRVYILSVALGSAVYLWNATTSETSELLNLADEGDSVTSVSWIKEVGVCDVCAFSFKFSQVIRATTLQWALILVLFNFGTSLARRSSEP